MAIKNTQEGFWSSEFGKEYTDRNSRDEKDWDTFYLDTYGITKIEINNKIQVVYRRLSEF